MFYKSARMLLLLLPRPLPSSSLFYPPPFSPFPLPPHSSPSFPPSFPPHRSLFLSLFSPLILLSLLPSSFTWFPSPFSPPCSYTLPSSFSPSHFSSSHPSFLFFLHFIYFPSLPFSSSFPLSLFPSSPLSLFPFRLSSLLYRSVYLLHPLLFSPSSSFHHLLPFSIIFLSLPFLSPFILLSIQFLSFFPHFLFVSSPFIYCSFFP